MVLTCMECGLNEHLLFRAFAIIFGVVSLSDAVLGLPMVPEGVF